MTPICFILAFTSATADFSEGEIHVSKREGHKLHNGNFIFLWIDTVLWKMVLTTNTGKVLTSGSLEDAKSATWKESSTWGVGEYTILNFRGRVGANSNTGE